MRVSVRRSVTRPEGDGQPAAQPLIDHTPRGERLSGYRALLHHGAAAVAQRELLDGLVSPRVRGLAPLPTPTAVAQRATITITVAKGGQSKVMTTEQAVQFAIDEGYIEEEQRDAATELFNTDQTFARRDDFQEFLEENLAEEEDAAGEVLTAADFEDSIKSTLGTEAEEDLLEYYSGMLGGIITDLEGGKYGIRYLKMEPEQKREVLHRLAQAIVALGNGKSDPKTYFNKNQVIIHGSYLFGASGQKPGDIDIIVTGPDQPKTSGQTTTPSGHLDREPTGDFSLGSKASILDFMVGIPVTNPEGQDLSETDPEDIKENALPLIMGLIEAAKTEDDAGKKARKQGNAIVAIGYLLECLGKDVPETLSAAVDTVNAGILKGSYPTTFGTAIKDGLAALED